MPDAMVGNQCAGRLREAGHLRSALDRGDKEVIRSDPVLSASTTLPVAP
jgi:hypothetical protein